MNLTTPQTLISYKQGLLGMEDFLAPEHKSVNRPSDKPMEICTTLQKGGWGWVKTARHLTPDAVMEQLAAASAVPANLFLNTRPLADGDIHIRRRSHVSRGRQAHPQQWIPPKPRSTLMFSEVGTEFAGDRSIKAIPVLTAGRDPG